MKDIVILGSTGSIGRKALEAVSNLSGHFRVVGLSANSNVKLLASQIRRFRPKFAALSDDSMIPSLRKGLGRCRTKLLSGTDGLKYLASLKEADAVLVAVVGSAALIPTLAAIRAGKRVALANKEALVMAGELMMSSALKYSAEIIPVDSEHSAIFQCLNGHSHNDIRNIFLTGSGGPFIDTPKNKLRAMKPRQALRHPKWKMGRKISIDSATLMNKGLEVIEAKWLFDTDIERIKVLIHPEAVIHSMVEFIDGSIKAQMGVADMYLPIRYAITYPDILPDTKHRIDPAGLGALTFRSPDMKRFPSLKLAYEAAIKGGSAPCVLNAANEEAVGAFLEGRAGFMDIPGVVEKVLSRHRINRDTGLDAILDTDRWARDEACRVIRGIKERRAL
ncbi:MAG: 1-deoxy-D-xylulose-5-phosphate reductoisomerase [Candidatus Omnitrophica bacterium CG1_02_49_10]|nr:MAG: 1-deoxy-D-xylulose-5-phosphate reductoisomerase [Candidatus Omnitrophica bacterium CG1_02_49_10]